MPDVVIAGPSLIYVTWDCRRCGHIGGKARTTIPLETTWTEAMGRVLFQTLKEKLSRFHQKHGCIAVPDDFRIRRYEPTDGKSIAGVV